MRWLFLTLNERDIGDINPNLKKAIILDFSSHCFKSSLSNFATPPVYTRVDLDDIGRVWRSLECIREVKLRVVLWRHEL